MHRQPFKDSKKTTLHVHRVAQCPPVTLHWCKETFRKKSHVNKLRGFYGSSKAATLTSYTNTFADPRALMSMCGFLGT